MRLTRNQMGPQLLPELDVQSVRPRASLDLPRGVSELPRALGLPKGVALLQPCGLLGLQWWLFSFDLKAQPQTREFEVLLFGS